MISWLLQKFIPDCKNTSDTQVRSAYGRVSGMTGIFCNTLLCLGKFLAGSISGSVSITADAINNLSDAASSIINLAGFYLAGKSADEEHPFGHARFEYISGLVVAFTILLIGVELLRNSVNKILHPSAVIFSWVSAGILIASILVKCWMAHFNTVLGKAISSTALIATAADSRNDALSTAGVLAASLISHFVHIELDGYVGVVVALFILYSGYGLIRDTLNPLLGVAPEEALVAHIQEKIMSYPGVLGTHDLMVHDYGPGRQFASVHVEVAAEADILESHDMIDCIERSFMEQDHLHMVIHMDPIVTNDSQIALMRQFLSEAVRTIHPDLTIHDLRMVEGTTHSNLIFDCVRPHGLAMTDSALKEQITQLVQETYPDYFCVITVDTSFAPVTH